MFDEWEYIFNQGKIAENQLVRFFHGFFWAGGL